MASTGGYATPSMGVRFVLVRRQRDPPHDPIHHHVIDTFTEVTALPESTNTGTWVSANMKVQPPQFGERAWRELAVT